MFTVAQRDAIRDSLVAAAHADDAIMGAAFVGSSATDRQDAWSDIDLALQMTPEAVETEVVAEWTERLYRDHHIVHHLDVFAGNGVRYRVFLTADSLQIDISFWPQELFRAMSERFQVIFGQPNEPLSPSAPNVDAIIGTAWLYALHVRSALARQTPWYAASLMDDFRKQILALACVRCGLNAKEGRTIDQLPPEFLARLQAVCTASVDIPAIQASFVGHMQLFQDEIAAHDANLAARLSPALQAMIR